MKTPTLQTRQSRLSPGFTLIELLVVMAIIAILAALTLSAFSYAQQAAAKNKTTGTMASLKAGLEGYKEKFGEYPAPTAKIYTLTFDSSGAGDKGRGAQMLYQAITGDGTDAIVLTAGGAKASDGEVDVDERPNSIVALLPPSQVYRSVSGDRFVMDGFGHPFQYSKYPVVADPAGQAQLETATVNETTYDLWSYGNLESTGANAAPAMTLSVKKDEVATATWIKNW